MTTIDAQETDALLHFAGPDLGAVEQLPQALEQRLHMRRQQSRLQFLQQLLEREQRMDFFGIEPDAWQFMSRPLTFRTKTIAAGVCIVVDRSVQLVA